MKKLSQRRKLLTQLILRAEIAELLFDIFTLNSGKHQNIYWIKCIFLTKRIPPRSLLLKLAALAGCGSAKILLQCPHSTFPTYFRVSARFLLLILLHYERFLHNSGISPEYRGVRIIQSRNSNQSIFDLPVFLRWRVTFRG